MAKTIQFHKLEGTGNDFLICYTPERALSTIEQQAFQPEIIKSLCQRHFGVGADGAIALHKLSPHHYRWDFFNSDGSSAEMCGNAARCVGRLLYRLESLTHFQLETKAGMVTVEKISDDPFGHLFSVSMPAITQYSPLDAINNLDVAFVNSGVPHAVVSNPNHWEEASLLPICAAIRQLPQFTTSGVNVTFYKEQDNNTVASKTFERGVNAFTLACGTGAVASAYIVNLKRQINQVDLCLPGGNVAVSFDCENPRLTGPAHYVATVSVEMKEF